MKYDMSTLATKEDRTERNVQRVKKRKHFTILSARHNKSTKISILFVLLLVFLVYLPASHICMPIVLNKKSFFVHTNTRTREKTIMVHTSFNPFPMPSSNVNTFRCVCLCDGADAHIEACMRVFIKCG